MAAILGRLESGAQPEVTCNQELLLTTAGPRYVSFEVSYNVFNFFADCTLHQGLMKCFVKSSSEENDQSLLHVSMRDLGA